MNDPIGYMCPKTLCKAARSSVLRLIRFSLLRAASMMPGRGRRRDRSRPPRHGRGHPPVRPPVQRGGSHVPMAVALVLPLAGCSGLAAAGPATLDRVTEIDPFVAGLELRLGVPADETRALLADARVLDSVLEAIQRPAERKPWHEYREIFITGKRIARGADFWRDHADSLARASERFGVPPEIIVAIIGVESFYGTYRGRLRVLDSLATLGFRYPRRSSFFLSELEEFVLLSSEERLDPRSIKGSYAGAMGIPQFISSSYRRYAIDFDGDGVRDLIGSPEDAIGSIGNYLAMHGWRAGGAVAVPAEVEGEEYRTVVEQGIKPHASLASIRAAGVGFSVEADQEEQGALLEFETKNGHEYWVGLTNFYVITRYNHSRLYALAVLQLAEGIRERFASG